MVKRAGNLMQRIASLENLQEAFLRAARGKACRPQVIAFRERLDDNLCELGHDLLSGTYRLGGYHVFSIYDPKKRTICAVDFRDRVAFHAMMRVCHPMFERYQISDSYASRLGKGTYKALERARQLSRRHRWFAKLDVRKYFDSVSHEALLRQLCRLFKDKGLLLLFRDIVESYETTPHCGLPIGNLTSQYFANHYLAVADHHAYERLHVDGYVRYMDDVLLFGDDKKALLAQASHYAAFLAGELRLQLHVPVVNRTAMGMPFLGYVVHPAGLRLNGRSARRFLAKMRRLAAALQRGEVSESEYEMRSRCLYAFVQKADASDFLYKAAMEKGICP